jgi:hypothetical protein
MPSSEISKSSKTGCALGDEGRVAHGALGDIFCRDPTETLPDQDSQTANTAFPPIVRTPV